MLERAIQYAGKCMTDLFVSLRFLFFPSFLLFPSYSMSGGVMCSYLGWHVCAGGVIMAVRGEVMRRLRNGESFKEFRRSTLRQSQFYKAVHDVHEQQKDYAPFKGAMRLFWTLNDLGFETFVASHRTPQVAGSLSVWLYCNNLLPYSGLYTGPDKKQFFRTGVAGMTT